MDRSTRLQWIIVTLLGVIILFVLGNFSFLYAAGKRTYGDVQATVIEVHDGDTLKVRVDSWPAIIGDGIGVRVYGVDCRELKSGAVVAKDVVKKWITEGSTVWLFGLRRDKYFRILASVGFDCVPSEEDPDSVSCTDLAEELLLNKLAVPYFGDRKKDFPKEIK